jgi:FAD/FMN-containing dehydrogenase
MLIEDLNEIVGAAAVRTAAEDVEPHVNEWRGLWHGKTQAVVLPATTREVSAVLRYCNEHGIGVVPQGGNTSLCAGSIPDESGTQVVLSLSRLNRIRSIDPDDYSMVAEAGCILATLQHAARREGRLFPLSLGAEGSCQIGGNLSTNAGGINVVRYGTARDQVLGLEVVLADGRVLDGLSTLRKNTAGYDLKHLFIGSEGTLGVITAASLKLYPEPGETRTAFLAMSDAANAVRVLSELRRSLADSVQAFELISGLTFEFVQRHIDGARNPFGAAHPWYVLLEAAVSDQEVFEDGLMRVVEDGLVDDVVIAKSESEAASLWRQRHAIAEAEKAEAPILKHDVSVPVARIPDFINVFRAELEEHWPEVRIVAFGHVGDGNLHYNIALPGLWSEERLAEAGAAITHRLYRRVHALGGSFSAEHGVGRAKRATLKEFGDPVALDLMATLKTALDPNGILNPGKVI